VAQAVRSLGCSGTHSFSLTSFTKVRWLVVLLIDETGSPFQKRLWPKPKRRMLFYSVRWVVPNGYWDMSVRPGKKGLLDYVLKP